ncbi:MAG: hypothetical protein OXH14_19770 [Alphaproteobacteria bacterium]|nr:hypothetical protein [Alphaproteobacteria bacterium]
MSGGIGLKAWEIRQIRGSMGVSLIATSFAVASAGAAIGLHWVALAYAAGAALALAALRTGATGGSTSRRLRRILARICEWELRIVALVLMFLAGMQVLAEFVLVPLEPLKALWDPEVTKAEIARAIEEGVGQALSRAESWILSVGISGAIVALLSGLTDWLVLSSVGARHGVSPWRVLAAGWSRSQLREEGRRERARRRRLLRGEA